MLPPDHSLKHLATKNLEVARPGEIQRMWAKVMERKLLKNNVNLEANVRGQQYEDVENRRADEVAVGVKKDDKLLIECSDVPGRKRMRESDDVEDGSDDKRSDRIRRKMAQYLHGSQTHCFGDSRASSDEL